MIKNPSVICIYQNFSVILQRKIVNIMKKGCFYLLIILVSLGVVGCEDQFSNTPNEDTTQLWPAGITHEVVIYGSIDDSDRDFYPDSTLYGYIDRHGNMVVRPQFYSAGSFSCGYAPVRVKIDKSNVESAYMDKKGNIHHIKNYPYSPDEGGICTAIPTPFYYNTAVIYHQTVPSVGNFYYSWMVDKNMNVVSDCISRGLLYQMTEDGLAAYVDDVNMEVSHYNKTGNKVLQAKALPEDPHFKDGYMILCFWNQEKGSSLHTIVDKHGHVVYEDTLPLTNLGNQRFLRTDHYALSSNEQFEIIDMHGHLLGSDEFSAPDFKEDRQFLVTHTHNECVSEMLPYYYINQNGQQTIMRSFTNAEPFYEGYAVVRTVEDWNLGVREYPFEIINTKGETVLTLEKEEEPMRVHNGLVLTRKIEYMNGRYQSIIHYAYKDLSGNVIYSWDEKILSNSSTKMPAHDRNTDGLLVFPEGLYMLGAY